MYIAALPSDCSARGSLDLETNLFTTFKIDDESVAMRLCVKVCALTAIKFTRTFCFVFAKFRVFLS